MITVLLVLFVVVTVYGLTQYVASGGGARRGLAPGFKVHQAMSDVAQRRKASTTRPATTITSRTPPSAVGIELCHVPGARRVLGFLVAAVAVAALLTLPTLPAVTAGIALGLVVAVAPASNTLYASLEEVVLVFAKPRMGKTALLANHVIDAVGACVVTSTKADIYTLTIAMRRLLGRPVLVFNPDTIGGILSTLRWSPIARCDEASVAIMRAGYLINGAEKAKGSSERDFWNGNAHRALRCHLMAAALGGYNCHDVQAWGQNLGDQVPIRVLRNHGKSPNGWATELERIAELPSRTRESISITLSSALAFMSDPVLALAATPGAGETTFDAEKFIRAQGTLYLLGKQRDYGAVGPLFAALAGELFEVAQLAATHRKKERLDPPLTAVLDEAALICRLPLERLTADCGGRGIPLIISIQGLDQLYEVWGDHAGGIIESNAGVKMGFGGLDSSRHLERLVKLCGTRIERRVTRDAHGKATGITAERVPVLREEDIRELPDFHVLTLYRNLGPVIGRIRPVWERNDVKAAGEPDEQKRNPTTPLGRLYDFAAYRARRNTNRKAS